MAFSDYAGQYVHAVRHQPKALQRVLDVFHMLAYLVPPGLGNVGEVTSELTSAVTSMLGEMNQHILAVPTASAPRYPKRPHSTALLPGVPLDACRWALTALSHFDVVLELSVSGAAGEKARLNLIAVVELLRCALKVAVLLGSGDRMLILGGRAHLDNVAAAIADSRAQASAAAALAKGKATPPVTPQDAVAHEGDVDPTSDAASTAQQGAENGAASAGESQPPTASVPNPPVLVPEAPPAPAADTAEGDTGTPDTPSEPPSFDPTPVGRFVPPVWWRGGRCGVRGMVSPAVAAAASGAAEAAAAGDAPAGGTRAFDSMAYTRRVELLALLGELLHIARPLVAALATRAQGRAGGWTPLLLSAAMDALSWQLSEYAAQEGGTADTRPSAPSLLDALTGRGAFKHISLRSGAAAGGAAAGDGSSDKGDATATPTAAGGAAAPLSAAFDSGLAALALRLVWWASSAATGAAAVAGTGRCLCPEEEAELTRRKRLWLLYLLRSPVFQRGTLPAAQRCADAAGSVPLLGFVAHFALGMLGYYNKVHFYNSGSS